MIAKFTSQDFIAIKNYVDKMVRNIKSGDRAISKFKLDDIKLLGKFVNLEIKGQKTEILDVLHIQASYNRLGDSFNITWNSWDNDIINIIKNMHEFEKFVTPILMHENCHSRQNELATDSNRFYEKAVEAERLSDIAKTGSASDYANYAFCDLEIEAHAAQIATEFLLGRSDLDKSEFDVAGRNSFIYNRTKNKSIDESGSPVSLFSLKEQVMIDIAWNFYNQLK